MNGYNIIPLHLEKAGVVLAYTVSHDPFLCD